MEELISFKNLESLLAFCSDDTKFYANGTYILYIYLYMYTHMEAAMNGYMSVYAGHKYTYSTHVCINIYKNVCM